MLPRATVCLVLGALAAALMGCQPAYVPACRLAQAQGVLQLPQKVAGQGLGAPGLVLSPWPGGGVLVRWWRAPVASGNGPIAELARFGPTGQLDERLSLELPGAWEGAPGRNPARPFVRTPGGIAALVVQTRARIEADGSVRLRSFLRLFTVEAASGAVASAELSETSCFECELWASLQRLEGGNAVLLAQAPADPGAPLAGSLLSVDDDGSVRARRSMGGDEPLPALLSRTLPDAVALLSGGTLRLWNADLLALGPPIGTGATAAALDWDLAASELIAGTGDGRSVFLEFFGWGDPGRAVRHRVSSGAQPFAVALGKEGPGMVFGDGPFTYFAHLGLDGMKKGPDVPLPPLQHPEEEWAPVDGQGVLLEVPGEPGHFAYFAAFASGLERHEVRCE